MVVWYQHPFPLEWRFFPPFESSRIGVSHKLMGAITVTHQGELSGDSDTDSQMFRLPFCEPDYVEPLLIVLKLARE